MDFEILYPGSNIEKTLAQNLDKILYVHGNTTTIPRPEIIKKQTDEIGKNIFRNMIICVIGIFLVWDKTTRCMLLL